MNNKKKTIFKLIISTLVIVLLFAICYLILDYFNLTNLSKENIQDFISKGGALGPIIFIAITFLQVTFIPIPSTVTILAGNYIFGFWLSFIYSVIGLFFGGLFAFFLGRKIGKPFLIWLCGSQEIVDSWLKKLKGRENILLFFMFLFPFFPDDFLCAIAGILPISYNAFISMTLITRSTSTLATLLFMSGEIIPYNSWGIPIIIVITILALIAFVLSLIYTEKIENFLKYLSDKITRFFKKR